MQNPCFWPLVFDAAILDRFPPFEKLAGLRNIVCLSVARATPAQTSGLTKIRFRGLGASFSNIWCPRRKQCSNLSKQSLKPAIGTRIPSRNCDKWTKTLTTDPVPHSKIPFTSGKETNFGLTVLIPLRAFCPKIYVFVKWES